MIARDPIVKRARRKPEVPERNSFSFSGPRGDVQTGGPDQMKKAQTYRTSRPYYHTYRQVFSDTPPVEHVKAEGRRSHDMKLKAQKLKSTQPQLSKHLLANANRMDQKGAAEYYDALRHGPDILSTEAYNKYANQLWRKAGSYYPPGKQPGLEVDYNDPNSSWAYAWVHPENRNLVHVRDDVPRQFMGPDLPGVRGPSESVLLHEWAHTRQSPETLRDQPKREGGAQALDQLLAKKLGIPFEQTQDPNYLRWAKRARRKGTDYLLRGQFQ